MSIGELLDRTFSLYRRHFWLFIGIMILPQLFILASRLAFQGGMFSFTGGAPGASAGSQMLFGAGVIIGALMMMFVFYMMFFVAMAATIPALTEILQGRVIGVRDCYARLKGKLGVVFGLLFTAGLLVWLGSMLCVVPGVLLLLRWAVVMPVAVVEGRSVGDSLKRSANLTEGRWGEAFLVFLLFVVINYVAEGIFAYPFAIVQMVQSVKGEDAYWLAVLTNFGEFVGGVLASPLLMISICLFYYDCRIRKEALDLQMMMAALDQAQGSSVSGTPAPPPGAA
jgi:hypothetical protein